MEELQKLIAETIRKIIREEVCCDDYINEEGFKILHRQEDMSPECLVRLTEDHQAIQGGQVKTMAGQAVLQELRAWGVQGRDITANSLRWVGTSRRRWYERRSRGFLI